MRYCPCCKDEFEEGEEFCNDCKLPLLGDIPNLTNLCECEDCPIGEHIAHMFEDKNPDAVAEVYGLTHLEGDALTAYINKLCAYNR
jgi:hypothetical protein